ncbi:Uncharacterised protein [Actinobacillus pleuropneumoniae]|jgi:hypothetical protein|nr:Uncharacterised protein [Actinobacillus pleuropneumoniae]
MFEKIQFEPGKIVYDDMQIDPNLSLESQIDNLKRIYFKSIIMTSLSLM